MWLIQSGTLYGQMYVVKYVIFLILILIVYFWSGDVFNALGDCWVPNEEIVKRYSVLLTECLTSKINLSVYTDCWHRLRLMNEMTNQMMDSFVITDIFLDYYFGVAVVIWDLVCCFLNVL